MKNLAFALVLLSVYSLNVFPQENIYKLYLGSGISIPSGPETFSDYWESGYNLNAGFGYAFTSNLSATLMINYNQFTFADEKLLEDAGLNNTGVQIDGGKTYFWAFTANLKYNFLVSADFISPYVTGGAGYFGLRADPIVLSYGSFSAATDEASESSFFVNAGAGLEIPISQIFGFFIEANYSIGFTKEENTNYIPLKVGLSLNI